MTESPELASKRWPRALDAECDGSDVRVSYFIVTKNRALYLRRVLDNVREFLDSQDELIVVDGGSTDGTVDVVGEYRDIVTIFVSEPDKGEGHALNKAIYLARGRLVKLLTDDDYFFPEAMKRFVEVADANPDCDALQAGGEWWTEVSGGSLVFDSYCRVEVETPTQKDIFRRVAGPGILIRRAALLQIGGCSPRYHAVDADIHCKLVEAGCRVRYLDVNLFRGYLHKHSLSRDWAAVKHSDIMCDLRLQNWREFFLANPRLVAGCLGLAQVPHGIGLQYAIYCSARLCFSRYGALLDYLPAALSLYRRIRMRLKRAGISAPRIVGANFSQKSPFTGELRG